MDREKVIYTLSEAKALCSSGKMSLRDAAVQSGVSETKLYREIRSDEEAYAEYKATHSIRMKLKSQFPNKARNARRVQKKSELAKENYFKKLMQKYHSTSIAEKLRKAKEMGLSYGRYMALCREDWT
jgi:IS30 family transposase